MSIIHHWKQTNSKGHIKKLETTMEDHQLIIYDECVYMCMWMCVCMCIFYFTR